MIKNYARDFDDKTLSRLLEEERYKCTIIRKKMKKLKEDFIFYLVVTIWLLCIIFFPAITVFGMVLFFYMNAKMELLNKRYYYQLGLLFVALALYWGAYYGLAWFPGAQSVLMLLPPFLLIVAGVCTLISGMRVLINTTLPGMEAVCNYLGKYNLARQKIVCDDKICRLESEYNLRVRRAEEQNLE